MLDHNDSTGLMLDNNRANANPDHSTSTKLMLMLDHNISSRLMLTHTTTPTAPSFPSDPEAHYGPVLVLTSSRPTAMDMATPRERRGLLPCVTGHGSLCSSPRRSVRFMSIFCTGWRNLGSNDTCGHRLGLDQVYWVLLILHEVYWVLLVLHEVYWVLLVHHEVYWVLLILHEVYWVLLVNHEVYWVLLILHEVYWVLLVRYKVYRVLLVDYEVYWDLIIRHEVYLLYWYLMSPVHR